jgi:polyisoprenoid-binding protein YceI
MAQDNEKQKYHLDPSQGEFLVKTGSGGVFGAFGHKHTISIRNFSGTLQFDPAHLENSSLEMNIQADQLEVVPSKKDDKDKPKIEKEMRENVLEVAEYPEIHFKSTSISAKKLTPDNYEVKIMGDLTLHGVTRNIPINAKVTMLENEVKAKGDFSLLQTDYKIKPYSAAGGTVKVKNKLDFAFDMVAHP